MSAAAAFGAATGLRGDALLIAAGDCRRGRWCSAWSCPCRRASPIPTTVLILGLMFGYAVSALVTVLVGASQPERLQQWAQWGFGSFSGVTWQRLRLFAPLTLVGVLLAAATTKQLNALLLGENYARSMGVAVRRARLLTMLGASVLGAVVTAFCGPIAFLGIAVPHLCRGLLGTSDHRVLVPAVVLLGGAVALVAQIVSLLPGSAGVLPLNAVTSLHRRAGGRRGPAAQPAGSVRRMTREHRAASPTGIAGACAPAIWRSAIAPAGSRRAVLEHVNLAVRRRASWCACSARTASASRRCCARSPGCSRRCGARSSSAAPTSTRFTPSELARRLGVVLTERVAVDALPVRRIVELGRYPHSAGSAG